MKVPKNKQYLALHITVLGKRRSLIVTSETDDAFGFIGICVGKIQELQHKLRRTTNPHNHKPDVNIVVDTTENKE